MDIDKIRPEELHEEMLLLREKSGVNFYLKEKHNFALADCPGCYERTEINFEFIKYGFRHMKCKKCNTLFVSPRPTEDGILNYYNNYEAPKKWTELLIKTNNERKRIQHLPRIELLLNMLQQANGNERKLLIDVGAGNGNFAKLVKDKKIFKEVVALDISTECINACKEQELKTYQGTISEIDNNSVDCITCNDLLEHLFNPGSFLSECHQKLKKSGMLMISTPNGEGFDFKILQDRTDNITPPEHLQYFNPVSINLLLEENGYESISIKTPGLLDVEIIKRHFINKNLSLKSSNSYLHYLYTLNMPEMLKALQKFLQDNLLSSHMLIFAIKGGC